MMSYAKLTSPNRGSEPRANDHILLEVVVPVASANGQQRSQQSSTSSHESPGQLTEQRSRTNESIDDPQIDLSEDEKRAFRYFFIQPWEKFDCKKCGPYVSWEVVLKIFKILLLSVQIFLFVISNQKIVGFTDDIEELFQTMLFNKSSSFFFKADIYAQMNFIRKQYSVFDNLTIGNFGYSKVKDAECVQLSKYLNQQERIEDSIYMCANEYETFESRQSHFIIDTQSKRTCHCLKPWIETESFERFDEFVPLLNGSAYYIDFPKTTSIELVLGVDTTWILPTHSLNKIDCYQITATVKFDNDGRTGKVEQTMNVDTVLLDCPKTENDIKSSKPIAKTLLAFDILVLVSTLFSSWFCLGWCCQGRKLQKLFKKQKANQSRNPSENPSLICDRGDNENCCCIPFSCSSLRGIYDIEFCDGWNVLDCISNLFVLVGIILDIVIQIRSQGTLLYDVASLFLGIGVICTYTSFLRYWGCISEYKILALAFKKSMKHILEYILISFMVFMGFLLCGWAILSPYHPKFKYFMTSSEALFSLLNGNDIFVTFQEMSQKSTLALVVSKIYLYTFISFFIYMVLNVFVTIIIDVYNAKKECKEHNQLPAKTEVQRFLNELKIQANRSNQPEFKPTLDDYKSILLRSFICSNRKRNQAATAQPNPPLV